MEDPRLKTKTAAIIGVSMLNSHFTKENIQRTADIVKQTHDNVFFMLPNKPAEHTLAGYGYSKEEAQKTVQRKFKSIERNCRKSIEALQIPDAKILFWEQFEDNENYFEMLTRLNELYATDTHFREDARSTTRAVYETSKYPAKKRLSLDEQVDVSVDFLLEELAFILSSPDILNIEGTDYVYHKEMPILSELLAGNYEFNPPKNVGFAVIE